MTSLLTNGQVKKDTGEIIEATEIKEGDRLYFDGSPDKTITVAFADIDFLRAEDSGNSYLFALTPAGENLIGALAKGMGIQDSDGGIDMEGEEGEAAGADLSLSGALQDLKSGASFVGEKTWDAAKFVKRNTVDPIYDPVADTAEWLKRKTYDKIVNPNDDIINPASKAITTDKLVPGDILLKKMHESDTVSGLIYKAQLAINGQRGYVASERLTHAMIYVGGGKVIEAVDNGVGISPLRAYSSFNDCNYNDYDFYVIRCKHDNVRQLASNAAKGLLFDHLAATMNPFEKSTPVRVKYAHTSLYLTILYKSLGGALNTDKFIDLARATVDSTQNFKNALNTNDNPKLFCSELVAYCYHVAADAAGKKRFFNGWQQNILGPEHLYVFSRNDSQNFDYMGRLTAHAS
ncbi:MAG: hypothetical protein JHC88_14800 [Niveispirillum sp.]|nr:hypothetical protein [Niveispirillum sp.]